jgi:hypothetical protein
MQKTVQKIIQATVGSKPSPVNRPDKTVEKIVEPTVRLVIDLEKGTVRTVKVKL